MSGVSPWAAHLILTVTMAVKEIQSWGFIHSWPIKSASQGWGLDSFPSLPYSGLPLRKQVPESLRSHLYKYQFEDERVRSEAMGCGHNFVQKQTGSWGNNLVRQKYHLSLLPKCTEHAMLTAVPRGHCIWWHRKGVWHEWLFHGKRVFHVVHIPRVGFMVPRVSVAS